jgi:hypothetical protein
VFDHHHCIVVVVIDLHGTQTHTHTHTHAAKGTLVDYSGSLRCSLDIAPMTFSDLLGECGG